MSDRGVRLREEEGVVALRRGGGGGLPPRPSRAQVCAVQMTFQGLTVTTAQFGTQPWFEPAYQCLTDTADRARVRAQKKAAGDTHLILEFFTHTQSIYDEAGQPYQFAISPSGEDAPHWFKGLVREVIVDGLIPLVVFDGDNGDAPADGYPNALRQLPLLVNLLDELNPYVLYGRLWDGVFYGSTPANIAHFGAAFRQLLPDGYLAIEHQPGRVPVGNATTDWETPDGGVSSNGAPHGCMQAYDVVMAEFQDAALHQDSTWQVAARMLGPDWRRPSDMHPDDDPHPPYYLHSGTPRGPYFAIAFEYYAYEWVRGRVDAATVSADRAYLRSLGYTYVC